jgi:hypothetical protein
MGLKDRLASRKRPSVTHRLRIDDDTAARGELAAAKLAGDNDRAAVARAAVEACYEEFVIVALPPGPRRNPQPDDPIDMETLLKQHPAPDGKKLLFNAATFAPALLAVCVQSEISEEEWADYLTTGVLNTGEAADLFNKAWEINYHIPSADIPKG